MTSIFGDAALPPTSKQLFNNSLPTGTGLDSSGFSMDTFNSAINNSPLNTTSGNFDLGSFIKNLNGGDNGIFGGFSEGLNKIGGLAGVADILGGVGGIFDAYNGSKQLGLAEDSFDFQKAAFNTNLANQSKLINNQLADQNIARQGHRGIVEGDAGYVNREDYLAKHGVSGKAI